MIWWFLLGGTVFIILVLGGIIVVSLISQKRLRRAQIFTQQVLDRTSALLVLLDRDGVMVRTNAAFKKALSRENVDPAELNFYSFAAVSPAMKRQIREGEELTIERSFPSRYGHGQTGDRVIQWHIRPFEDGLSGTTLRIATGIDISDRKEAEDRVTRQRERLRTLSTRLIRAHEQERERIAREIHDEFGQALTALRVNLVELELDLPESISETIFDRLVDSKQLLESSLKSMRTLAHELRPSIIDDIGLVAAVRSYGKKFAKRLQLDFEFQPPENEYALSPETEIVIYRIVQEACTNIAKHAEASSVRLSMEFMDSQVRMVIADDGRGFDYRQLKDEGELPRGIGLLGMEERVTSLGGNLKVDSASGEGTRITITIPTGDI